MLKIRYLPTSAVLDYSDVNAPLAEEIKPASSKNASTEQNVNQYGS